ncbi:MULTISPECIES: response regulator transcription factor [Achromobacter]|uniref:Response regulator transcription factor n=1 Tax=Achromobacter spanius TaxID=217203 RepID=A0ABY8H1Z0_9BURK|nr:MULTISPECIES: response regulator transcription factor [Achromobacter]WAI85232.1 response regulator transcription factor [Achromobacter spanius]WEX95314.1 response regulator transcription factor [Achromobacter sp. SS2-2022]WFP10967.1 response regulator transcription factor [Achromobacter spanius]
MRILLVEDDPMLGDALRAGLAEDGADVDWARSLPEAQLALVDHGYQAVLLDLGLAAGSGLTLLKTLRGRFDTTPVLIITARDRLSERIQGLDAGADDYLVKPFQLDELLARLRAVLRRSSNSVVSALRCRDVVLEPAGRVVKRGGQEVSLSAHEYHTLLALMQRMGHTVSRDQLEVAVYGSSGTIESNTVAVYIHQLRRKLGEGLIETQHGLGYRMVAGAAP